MISVRNLSYSIGTRIIFDGVTFAIPNGLIVGIVGHNGAGKSTLLKLIVGEESPDSGTVELSGTVGFVPQEVKQDVILENSETIRDYIDPYFLKQDFELQKMLNGLELVNLSLEHPPLNLSGGQKTKLALLRAIIAEPDILILDEPTNFLDVSGKRWVMSLLSRYENTVLIISHDLDLLDKDLDKVLEVNSHTQKIDEYSGNYSQYLKLKNERTTLLQNQVSTQQKAISRLEESIKKVGVRQRIIMQRRVERMKDHLPELPPEVRAIKFQFPDPARVGEIPLKVNQLSKSYGEKQIFKNITFNIRRGERLALLGPNGVGKSTLLKALAGIQSVDSGEIVKDSGLKIGYYSQEFETFDQNKTIIEVAKLDSKQGENVIRPVLGRFLFLRDKVYQQISTLSGGEKTRLAIALLVLQDYNLLILDEPTTYLDILSQRLILEALKEYKGSMIIVSHTEEFITGLNPDNALLLPENYYDVWSDNFLSKVEDM